MRIPAILTLFLLTAMLCFTACEATKEAEQTITFTHTKGAPQNKGVIFATTDFPQPFALMDGKQEVPYQLDDLNGDGQPDEAFALVNFRPTEKKEGSTLTLTVQAVASSEVEAKTQAFLLRQPHTYDPDSVKKLTGDYQRIQEYDVPDNLKPQGYWLKFEGPSWENDVVGYRVYMDTRNRYDIFGKQVSDLVMDTVALDYHKINPWGADILKVGNSLGIGSPALLVGDSLMAFENYAAKRFELVTSGPLRSIFRIHFTQLAFGDDRMDLMVEHEMHAGHRWTEIRIHVLKTTIKNPTFATGLVKHPAAPDFEVEQYKNQHIGYTYGAQSFHDEVLGMAIIVPDNQDVQAVPGGLLDSHVFTFSAVNGVASYRFLAAWEREPGALTDEAAFAKHLRAEATAWE